jgi:hypothetical protein
MPGIIVGAMTGKLTASLRQAPTTVPSLAAVALFVVWAGSQAGYPVTHWGPGGLIVLALLALSVGLVGLRAREVVLPARIALACLAAYTALSYLSIIWAAVPEDAWEGANRTLLYLLVFALFACWRQRGASAVLLLAAWTLAITGLAVFTAVRLDAATSVSLQTLLPGGRLVYPSGYPNANAAQWLMAFWPALLLARSARLPWAMRGLLAGAAVLLADVALLSQSRGSLYATPVMLVLVFALLPGRTRTFALLLAVAGGVAATAPTVLRVGDRLHDGAVVQRSVHSAIAASFLAAAIVGLAVALAAAIESRRALPPASAARVHRWLAAIAIAALVAVLLGGLAVAGNPITRIRDGWHSFKGGYAANSTTSDRLVSGLGSNRYDFYRVAIDEFLAHPVLGIGADNFQQQYLAHGRSEETPRYPHSVELRTLSQTGIVGAVLALGGLLAALTAVWRALRSSDELGRVVAAAAAGAFAYWAVHGSLDWFWEFAGLGAPAFALLGLACALAPAKERLSGPTPAVPRARLLAHPRVLADAGLLLGLAAAVSLAAPWLSQLQVQRAAHIWTTSPRSAYAQLSDAARLNPLSDEAYLTAGSIALRYGELTYADHEFTIALQRSPGDAYATLERGAIASASGHRTPALRLLERAVALNPRDELTRAALALVRAGKRLNLDELNLSILRKAQQLA